MYGFQVFNFRKINNGFQTLQGIDVASDHSKIVDFFQFAEKVHELADCTKDNCELGAYVGCLKGVLLNSTKTYEDKKSFFISHLIHFSDVYKFMSALK